VNCFIVANLVTDRRR